MSARNYLSSRGKSASKFFDCLPDIKQQKFYYRPGPDLHSNASLINRNINYSFEVQQYPLDNGGRAGTPFSDCFSESETGTPDFRSEESDSSAGSVLRRNTAEATRALAEEWQRIERTIYDEDGEKTSKPAMLDECRQWRQLHPQLRVIGRPLRVPEKKYTYRQIELDEIIASHYSDYDEFSESGERLSQSSTDVTPQNSPRVSMSEDFEPRITREKVSYYPTHSEEDLRDTFGSLLQITPIQMRSPKQRKRQNSSILKSEMASSKWMRGSRPDSVNDRNSAKSFISLDYCNLAPSASIDKTTRVVTGRQREPRLEPLYTPETSVSRAPNFSNTRKVSLPPLLLEEERRKIGSVGSAKKHGAGRSRKAQRSCYMEKTKNY